MENNTRIISNDNTRVNCCSHTTVNLLLHRPVLKLALTPLQMWVAVYMFYKWVLRYEFHTSVCNLTIFIKTAIVRVGGTSLGPLQMGT